ncbi:MAG TPA: phosphotransferase [Fimbriimonas sp.]|nr:phosphotransferase [Fimbriimonas sp.]
MNGDLSRRIEEALATFSPGSQLLRSWPLRGGISGVMTGFEAELPSGETRKFIARLPCRRTIASNPDLAGDEFRVLKALNAAKLPVQSAVHLESKTEETLDPFYVVGYVEGKPKLAPADKSRFLTTYATQLAEVHRVDHRLYDFGPLRKQGRGYPLRPEKLNAELREGEIRDLIENAGGPSSPNPWVFSHGDFWPGNLIWRDQNLVAVIDWEEVMIGEPLTDLSICRLDLWWILGRDAMEEFTEVYQSLMNLDLTDLPYWDLCVSLRLINMLEAIGPAYPDLGRPDITTETLKRNHQEFVEQAMEKLARRQVVK